ncbi:hypothetical protein ACLB2K_036087 [Fragaria x ananassa]
MKGKLIKCVAIDEVGKAIGQVLQGGLVQLFIRRGSRVRRKEHSEPPDERLTRRRLAAQVGHDAGDDDLLDAPLLQVLLEAGAAEGAVSVLFDDVVLVGPDFVELRYQLGLGGPVEDEVAVPPLVQHAVVGGGLVGVAREDDGDGGASAEADGGKESELHCAWYRNRNRNRSSIMSYLLPHLRSGWAVDQAILAEEERVVIVRFGHDWDDTCMQMDEVLAAVADKIKNFAVIYLVDISEVPDFNTMYELYDPSTVMFFFRNKHIMIDLGTGNNNKINWALKDKQEFIVETVYRGARKGRGLVIAPKDYSTKYRY